ncbi:MAG TPA: DUF4142 domain-containing protein [Steroidobacteraceae bacterium]|jgi:putative membrane protein|nr:DUF4142 domain-containing protein [Steroidobacteraceae bacterium]
MHITPAIAACIAALGCSAALAQPTGGPNGPQNAPSPPSVTGAPSNADEPSAATPGSTAAGVPAGVNRSDTQRFITDTTYANQAEIANARYALAHSESADVKQFARQMITDHTKANGELKRIAAHDGYSAPTGLQSGDREAMARLELERGAAFDASYAQSQAQDHTEVVAQFKRAEQDSRLDPAVRRFAQMTLPTLEDHLQMANQLVASHAQGNRSAG